MRILSFTTLYPNPSQPVHGVFVENRLRHLAQTGRVSIKVVAPVPWFPRFLAGQKRYGHYARVPLAEMRHGLDVIHPRYPTLPKIGMTIAPLLLALSQRAVIAGLIQDGYDFDLIDAHYFYPDGVAAIHLGRWFNKPVVITGRGSDLSQIPQHALPRQQIKWAAARAAGMVTVCQALKDALIALGVAPERVVVLRNGVDLKLFRPPESPPAREALRARWNFHQFSLVSVGQLIERKGHGLIIDALTRLPGTTLAIAGGGPERAALEAQAKARGVADRVRFLGVVPHDDLPSLYGAADALVLASSREGWANVLLEAMACGTPVVASPIWGTPEVVAEPAAGVMMPERSAEGVVAGVGALRAQLPDRAQTRGYAERFSWDSTTSGQLDLFSSILSSRSGRPVNSAS